VHGSLHRPKAAAPGGDAEGAAPSPAPPAEEPTPEPPSNTITSLPDVWHSAAEGAQKAYLSRVVGEHSLSRSLTEGGQQAIVEAVIPEIEAEYAKYLRIFAETSFLQDEKAKRGEGVSEEAIVRETCEKVGRGFRFGSLFWSWLQHVEAR
jgi:hypothetical protein